MKKLLTVFTAAGLLVAGGSSAFALQGETDTTKPFVPFVGATDTDPGHLSPEVDAQLRDQLAKKGHQRTADENGGVWVTDQDGKKVFVPAKKGAAPAKKAPAKAGATKDAGKVLPKTSAAK